VVGRGGLLNAVAGPRYAFGVNEQMVDDLLHRPAADHASNLGAVIAYTWVRDLGIPAFYRGSVVGVDEYEDVARISGYSAIERQRPISRAEHESGGPQSRPGSGPTLSGFKTGGGLT